MLRVWQYFSMETTTLADLFQQQLQRCEWQLIKYPQGMPWMQNCYTKIESQVILNLLELKNQVIDLVWQLLIMSKTSMIFVWVHYYTDSISQYSF